MGLENDKLISLIIDGDSVSMTNTCCYLTVQMRDLDIGFAYLNFDFLHPSSLPTYILSRCLSDASLKIEGKNCPVGVLAGVVIRSQSVAFFLDFIEYECLNS
jgi:hypothetical protein